jgi:hypothetical protein
VLHQRRTAGRALPARRARGLQGEPLVEHQRLVAQRVKRSSARAASGGRCPPGLQGVQAVGHVAGVLEALVGLAGPDGVALGGQAQHGQGLAGQGAAAGTGSGGRRRCRGGAPRPRPVGAQGAGQLAAHGFAHGVHALRIDVAGSCSAM